MPTSLPTFTARTSSKAAFVHFTDVILENYNVTAAFKENGIDEISSILKLTDTTVGNLTFPDADPNVSKINYLKNGEIELLD
jgi:hypothetical protein